MNIVVFGGGAVNKLGNDICVRARQQGHNVIIFSHKDNGTNDSNQLVIDYLNVEGTKTIIENVLSKLDKIDIVLFNQNGGAYPSGIDLLNTPNVERYQHTINTHILIPQLFLSLAKDKLPDYSKVINMTSNLAFMYDRPEIAHLVGYASGKSFLTHYIQTLGLLRKNKVTYFTLSPSINYDSDEGKQRYPLILDSIYNFILSATDEYNAEIVSAWEPNNHRKMKIEIGFKQ